MGFVKQLPMGFVKQFHLSASVFAIFKFSQSLSAAIAFFYSLELSLYYQVRHGVQLLRGLLGCSKAPGL